MPQRLGNRDPSRIDVKISGFDNAVLWQLIDTTGKVIGVLNGESGRAKLLDDGGSGSGVEVATENNWSIAIANSDRGQYQLTFLGALCGFCFAAFQMGRKNRDGLVRFLLSHRCPDPIIFLNR
ncbi:MAG: hypothetical protein AAF609_04295 [Cyanobacteria bacterium P01_C01_bin.120]